MDYSNHVIATEPIAITLQLTHGDLIGLMPSVEREEGTGDTYAQVMMGELEQCLISNTSALDISSAAHPSVTMYLVNTENSQLRCPVEYLHLL